MSDQCKRCPTPKKCKSFCRYPYRHRGPSVHGSKLMDYLVSEASLREDMGDPERFGNAP